MEKYVSMQIKDKGLLLRVNSFAAKKSAETGKKIYNFEIIEKAIIDFLNKEGA
jgi:hypothetical protein